MGKCVCVCGGGWWFRFATLAASLWPSTLTPLNLRCHGCTCREPNLQSISTVTRHHHHSNILPPSTGPNPPQLPDQDVNCWCVSFCSLYLSSHLPDSHSGGLTAPIILPSVSNKERDKNLITGELLRFGWWWFLQESGRLITAWSQLNG